MARRILTRRSDRNEDNAAFSLPPAGFGSGAMEISVIFALESEISVIFVAIHVGALIMGLIWASPVHSVIASSPRMSGR